MPIGLGPWELILVLLIVVVIFGAGRIGDIGGALGKGIKEFRSATRDDEDKTAATTTTTVTTTAAPAAPAENKCPSCGTVNAADQSFCGQCGTRLTKAA